MTFSTIVVGVDFSPPSDRAVQQALAVARHTGARLILVHVGLVPEPPAGIPPSMEATAAAYAAVLQRRLGDDRARLEALRGRLSGQGVEISHDVIDGFADTGLVEAAAQLRADLLVIGTHGRTGVRRLLLGSTAERTLRAAGCSVLVVRGPHDADAAIAEGGFRRVVVGSDFSASSDEALTGALELTAPGADVHVVHCWQAPGVEVGLDALELGTLHATLATELARYHAEQTRRLLAAHAGARVTLWVDTVEAPPAAGLDDAAEADRADLVVVGSHGRRGVRRLLLGSVAEATVRHAPCSVLIVRTTP